MKISVIVPIYNTGKKLINTLRSIQKQTFLNFECVMVDDGSTDVKTHQIIREFVDLDSRFVAYYKGNEGIEKSRLFGVEKSKTDLLVFCDHDDVYEKNALSILYEAYENSKADIIVANCYLRPFYYNSLFQKELYPRVIQEEILDGTVFIKKYFMNFFGMNKFPVSTWGKMYNKGLFNQSIHCFGHNFIEDIVINIQLFAVARSIHFISANIYTHVYGGLGSKLHVNNAFDGYNEIYLFRKRYLDLNGLNHKSLLIEYKNVVVQNIQLMIDYKFSESQFIESVSLLASKVVFQDLLQFLSVEEKGEYISMIEAGTYSDLYSKALKDLTLGRRMKHILKSWARKL